MKVEQLMTREVGVVHPETSLNQAAQLMLERDCGALPVVPAPGVSDEEGPRDVVGMITDRDICMAAHRRGGNLNEIRVRDAMSGDVLSCAPDDDHSAAQRIMREARVRRVPVVQEGRLRGILSLAQIARASATGGSTEVSEEEVGSTLASICEPTSGSRIEV